MKNKNVIRRALPLNTTYTVKGFNYVPLIDGGGSCCDNCGKPISNLVTLQDTTGNRFVVGSDCAETLAQKDLAYIELNYQLSEGKNLRTRIRNAFKKQTANVAYIYTSKTDGEQFLVIGKENGPSAMLKISYPETSLHFIKDLLTK